MDPALANLQRIPYNYFMNLKLLTRLLVVGCLVLLSAPSGGDPIAEIDSIRARQRSIAKNKDSYKQVQATIEYQEASSTEKITGFYDKNVLRLIERELGGDWCLYRTQFYLHKGAAFFVFEDRDCRYAEGGREFIQTRLYLQGKTCLRKLVRHAASREKVSKIKNKSKTCPASDVQDQARAVQEAIKALNRARKKKPGP